MTISDFAIKRPIVTVVTMLALVIFGIFALFKLDVDEFPDLANPIVVRRRPLPRRLARRRSSGGGRAHGGGVQRPLAGSTRSTPPRSTASPPSSCSSSSSKDPDQATQDMRDAISGIRNDLPPEMKEPVLRKFDPDDHADRLAGARLGPHVRPPS